jgi:thioredoxin 1
MRNQLQPNPVMKTSTKKIIATALVLAVAVGLVAQTAQTGSAGFTTNASAKPKLPRLVDLGADKCIPCKKMAPILRELKSEYAGRLEVEFIDVWKKPEAAKPYKIRLIPTQIFYDANGKELFRHEGFFGKEDILAKWKELGVDVSRQAALAPQTNNATPAK